MQILVLGRSGQVASALSGKLALAGQDVLALSREELDLNDPAAARVGVLAARPDIVINAAAYTAVDQAEGDADAAYALNATGPAAAAAAAAELGVPFVHFSTDYVFDGSKGRPYLEGDETSPLGIYGQSKLAGEIAVATANPHHVILRTSWVCSADGNNFLRTMLRLAGEREEMGVVDDQTGQPTFAPDLADAVVAIINHWQTTPSRAWGVFHAVSQGETTWCGFARAIMAGSEARGGPSARIKAIGTADFPTPARRPADSRLGTDKLAAVYGISLPHWQVSLDACLDEIYGTSQETTR
ncbi:dTDP-4-dehydrorhamnose reductase [Brevundimonas sp.]|uniref:dTDP-4-dehydrorhamnose reductase n=1 Tax=Brevundimonas sp. TaxID=1871086 RepID=UPI003A92BC5F